MTCVHECDVCDPRVVVVVVQEEEEEETEEKAQTSLPVIVFKPFSVDRVPYPVLSVVAFVFAVFKCFLPRAMRVTPTA